MKWERWAVRSYGTETKGGESLEKDYIVSVGLSIAEAKDYLSKAVLVV